MMTTGDGFSLNSGFTKILCTPEKPLVVFVQLSPYWAATLVKQLTKIVHSFYTLLLNSQYTVGSNEKQGCLMNDDILEKCVVWLLCL